MMPSGPFALFAPSCLNWNRLLQARRVPSRTVEKAGTSIAPRAAASAARWRIESRRRSTAAHRRSETSLPCLASSLPSGSVRSTYSSICRQAGVSRQTPRSPPEPGSCVSRRASSGTAVGCGTWLARLGHGPSRIVRIRYNPPISSGRCVGSRLQTDRHNARDCRRGTGPAVCACRIVRKLRGAEWTDVRVAAWVGERQLECVASKRRSDDRPTKAYDERCTDSTRCAASRQHRVGYRRSRRPR